LYSPYFKLSTTLALDVFLALNFGGISKPFDALRRSVIEMEKSVINKASYPKRLDIYRQFAK